MGLPLPVQNLLIQLYADQANRSFYLHGGPYHPKLDDLPDELELREQPLPSQEQWDEALQRGGKVFGLAVSPLRNATNASDLGNKLGDVASCALEPCQTITDRLEQLCADWDIHAGDCRRLQTADAVLALVRGLATAETENRVGVLAGCQVATSLDAMATSYRKAAEIQALLASTRWDLLEGLRGLADERAAAALGIIEQLVEALKQDEYAVTLRSRLSKLESDAVRLLTVQAKPNPFKPPESARPGTQVLEEHSRSAIASSAALALLEDLKHKLEQEGDLRLDLSWKLYRDKAE
jgi:hypothetical protein